MQLIVKKTWWQFFLVVTIALSLWGRSSRQEIASAQSPDDAWITPQNVSQSGATSEPRLIIDAQGVVHIIWKDDFAGMVYTRLEGASWSTAVPGIFPFDEIPPVFMADRAGFIHAFWLTNTDDLYYSRSQATLFGQGGWSVAILLATGVGNFNVALADSSDNLHLAYIRTADDLQQPAGVYYLASITRGETWGAARLLYSSKYLRSLDTERLNVQVDTASQANGEAVYIAWDDPALKRVYLAISLDGGQAWEALQEVDSPEINTITRDPFGVRLKADGNQVLVVWQAGLQSGFACTQYYRSSSDGGKTWSTNQAMLSQLVGCAQDNRFFQVFGSDGYLLLYTVFNNEIYLSAWDGRTWSELQPQWQLYSFIDPVTLETVNFDCRQPAINTSGQLYVIGCDTVGEKDVWVTWRALGGIAEWFPPPAAWSKPAVIARSALPVTQLESLSDPAGLLHVFWLQEDIFVTNSGEKQLRSAVFYQRLDADALTDLGQSSGVKILSSPDGYAKNFALALGRQQGAGKVYLAWEGGNSGRVYFSYASLAFADSPFEWSKPLELPLPVGAGEIDVLGWSPDLAVDASGGIYAVYARPVNQGRGIYLVKSVDDGATWSEPHLIFDAEAAGWTMVAAPRLAVTGGEGSAQAVLHLLWTQNTPVGNGRPLGVYYASSIDGGETWNEVSQVIDQPATQLELLVGKTTEIHRFWLTQESGAPNMYQQVSSDGGTTWDPPTNLNYLGEIPGPANLVVSAQPTDDLTLFQLVGDDSGAVNLVERVWESERWLTLEEYNLGTGSVTDYLALAGALGLEGQARIVYLLENPDARKTTDPLAFGEAPYELVYLGKTGARAIVTVVTAEVTPEVPATLQATAVAESVGEQTPEELIPTAVQATPAATLPVELGAAPAKTWFNLTTGALLAALQAAFVIGTGYLFIRLRRRSGQ